MILPAEPDIDVVGEAGDGLAAVHATRVLHPDLVLIDSRMHVPDGVEATRTTSIAAASQSRVLVLTTFDLDEYVFEALRAGASGFLHKDAPRTS